MIPLVPTNTAPLPLRMPGLGGSPRLAMNTLTPGPPAPTNGPGWAGGRATAGAAARPPAGAAAAGPRPPAPRPFSEARLLDRGRIVSFSMPGTWYDVGSSERDES